MKNIFNYWYNRLFTSRVMLWDKRHQLWERSNYMGYTANVYEAGWFERDRSMKLFHSTAHARTEMRRK